MARYLHFLLLFSFIFLSGFMPDDKDKHLRKPGINDQFDYIAANNIMMWLSNNGSGSHDPRTGGNGLYWPGGEFATKSAVFQDGLIFGAMVNNEIRVGGNTHRVGLQAGKIITVQQMTPHSQNIESIRL
jgi:hypothetical protein